MTLEDSVSSWVQQVKSGNREPVRQLLDRYLRSLTTLAAARMKMQPMLAGYSEDVALSAMKSLCMGAERGRFPELSDRDDLWRLLCVITIRKSIDLTRKKRVDQTFGEEDLNAFLSREPSPEEAAETAERVHHLLDQLGDPELRQIALWKVEGRTNEEIADNLGCVERSVERKLRRIRLLWQKEVAS